ncbi:MAG: acyltransferase [Myxococcaceae bacterium]|nr:acyltransferase [Myxococcaceae bacterium]MCI0668928.1 acyltransferase [Myxococcaceae bacterium]
MSSPAQGRLDALTGARFIAALHVLLYHFGAPLFAALGAPAWLEAIRAGGYASVSFFFVLSGFILVYTHPSGESARPLERRVFWLKRLSRIYPMYLVALLLTAPFVLRAVWNDSAKVADALVSFTAHAGMVQAWLPQRMHTWNVPGWTVAVELFFYVVFPWAQLGMDRIRRRRSLWLWMAALYVVSTVLHKLGADPVRLDVWESGPFGAWVFLLRLVPLIRLPEFLIGMALGRLFLLDRAEGRAMSRTWSSVVTWGAGAAAAGLLMLRPLVADAGPVHDLLTPVFALGVMGLASGGGSMGGLLGSRPMALLGEASYALYILQQPLRQWVDMIATGLGLQLRTPGLVAVYVALSIAISIAAFRWVERPLQRVLRERLTPALRGTRAGRAAVDPAQAPAG